MATSDSNSSASAPVYYCSSKSQSSIEDGTIEHPYKSLTEVHRYAHDGSTVLLERGGEYQFFNEFNSRTISFGAYGNGTKPVISRFAKVRNDRKSLFTRDSSSENIWTLNFNLLVELSGRKTEELTNIGFIYNPYTDEIVYGRKVAFPNALEMYMAFNYQQPTQGQIQAYTCLSKDGDFYQSSDGHTIKVYSSVNPNDSVYPQNFNTPPLFEDQRNTQELWFATGGSFIVHPRNCCIQDIKITGFGRHAIEGGMNNVLIDNVDVDLVGGMTQNPMNVGTPKFVRLGDGIEVWCSTQIPSKDTTVKNCLISRVFDGGATIQGYLDEHVKYAAENIAITENVFKNCRLTFEGFAFYNEPDGSIIGEVPVQNCYFSNNKSYNAGNNGFNCPEPRDCHLYNGMPGMIISNNYFYNGNYIFRYTEKYGFEMNFGNICHIRPGQYMLQESTDTRKYIYYPENPTIESVMQSVTQYRVKTPDLHTTFVGIDSIVSEPE